MNMNAGEAAIRLTHLVKSFGDVAAVDDVSLAVPKGAFLVLVGPSGCGKSTLLRMLAGLDAPSKGEIAFMGRVVSKDGAVVAEAKDRDAGLVFQSYALWPHMTVAQNIAWPLKVAGWDKAARAARVDEVLQLLGISALSQRYPAEISGGQQQRVAIARTIAPKPSILLFDEPLSNLDAKLRIDMRCELMRIHRATGATSVYVTHDQVEAMTMASHVAVLNHGVVEQFGAPAELLKNPATTFVATFLGTPPANLVPVERVGDHWVSGGVKFGDGALAPGETRAHFLYRAEALSLGEAPGRPSLNAQFSEAAPIAGQIMVTATHGDLRLTAMVPAGVTALPGDAVTLSFPPQPEAIFAADGRRLTGVQ